MTEQDLKRIETELNVRLPEDYQAYCLSITVNCADPIAADPIGIGADYNGVYGDRYNGLFSHVENVIQSTRDPIISEEDDLSNWKPDYIVIGETGAGDLYLLDTSLAVSPLYVKSHEDASIVEEYPTLADYLADYARIEKEFAVSEAVRLKQQAEIDKRFGCLRNCLVVGLIVGIILIILIGRSKHPPKRIDSHKPARQERIYQE